MREKFQKTKEKTKKFISKHKKEIAIGAGIVTALAGVAAYIAHQKNNSTGTIKYTNNFFKNATDGELSVEREKVRQQFANAGLNNLNDKEVDDLYWLLNKFDNVIGERAWAGKKKGYPVHREHGWHLSNDD